MTTRIFSWSLLLLIIFCTWHYRAVFSNPWAIKSPVIAVLPAAAPGCGEGCK